MFGWLRRLIYGTARRDPRAVFAFWDGLRERVADPVEAWQRLDAAGDWQDWLRTLATAPPPVPPKVDAEKVLAHYEGQQIEASRKLSDAVCGAFGVAPLAADGSGGLTLTERIACAAAFLKHMGRLAEMSRPFASSRPPTG